MHTGKNDGRQSSQSGVASIAGTSIEIDMTALDAYRSGVIRYLAAMAQSERALGRGLITRSEYSAFEEIIAKKYGLDLCSIFRQGALISPGFGGTISHHNDSDTDWEVSL